MYLVAIWPLITPAMTICRASADHHRPPRDGTHRRDRDAIGNLAHHRAEGAQSWGRDIFAPIPIDHDSRDSIVSRVRELQQEERFGEFSGLFQFGDKTEERNMAGCEDVSLPLRSQKSREPTIGKYNVRDSKKSLIEVGLDGCFDRFPRMFNTNGDHGDHNGGKDAKKR